MAEIPRQHIQLTPGAKASATGLLSGQGGRIQVGVGAVNTPQVPSGGQYQFIPQPTALGQQVGQDVSAMAQQAGEIAFEIYDQQARAEAAHLAAVADQQARDMMIGDPQNPGVMTLSGRRFVNQYEQSKEDLKQFFNTQASSIDSDLTKSYYLASVQKSQKALQTQLRDKYLGEFETMKQEHFDTVDEKNIGDMAGFVYTANTAQNGAGFKTAMNAAVVDRMLNRQETRDQAFDAIAVDFVKAYLPSAGIDGLDNLDALYITGAFNGISVQASAEIEKVKTKAFDAELKALNRIEKLDDIQLDKEWQKVYSGISAAAYATADDPRQRALSLNTWTQKMMLQDETGELAGRVEAVFNTIQTNVPLTDEAATLLEEGKFLGTPVHEVVERAAKYGLKIPKHAITEYRKDVLTEYRSEINEALASYKRQLKTIIADPDGKYSHATGAIFFESPQGSAFIEARAVEQRRLFREAAIKGGSQGITQALQQAVTSAVTPGEYGNNAMVKASYDFVNTLPDKYSPLRSLNATTSTPGQTNTPRLPDTITKETLESMLKSTFKIGPGHIKDAQQRAALKGLTPTPEMLYLDIMHDSYLARINQDYPAAGAASERRLAKSRLKMQIDLLRNIIINPGVSAKPKPPTEE